MKTFLPYPADGHIRQAFVLCWMMLPRTGGRDFSDTHKIVTQLFERNIDAWHEDWKAALATRRDRRKRKKTGRKVSKKAAKKKK